MYPGFGFACAVAVAAGVGNALGVAKHTLNTPLLQPSGVTSTTTASTGLHVLRREGWAVNSAVGAV